MADPLSISASIAALLQLSAVVIKYLSDAEDARDDLKRLQAEVISAVGLLSALKELAAAGEAWLPTVRSLNVPGGPLEQFRSLLESLAEKLPRVVGLKKVLGWSFQKSEVKEILCAVERQKMLFSLALQNDHLRLSKAIEAAIAEVGIGVQETAKGVVELRRDQRDQESVKIIAWLSTLNFFTQQNDFFGRRQEGTGEWLLETDAFRRWLNGSERTLWCPGLPGAGKTILTSIVVNYLEQTFKRENIAIVYIYCNYKEQSDQTAVNLIASLLQQLVQKNDDIPDRIRSLYQSHIRKQTRPTLGEYSSLLQLEIREFSKVFIAIDALDECPESNGTRDLFLDEIRKLQPSIYLLVTSRHISTIDREFEKAARVEIHASDEDVRRYLDSRIKKERRLVRHIEADPSLQGTIVNTIVRRTKGMFLLAQLHVDSLAKKNSRRDVRKALENMPNELDDIYNEALQRVESQDKDDVKLAEGVLSWISFAFRPLTIRELQHALAVGPGDADMDEEALPDEDLLVSICAGLVTIDQESNVIRLVHYTVQEYFERIRAVRFPRAQTNIATTCLTYLSFSVFATGCNDIWRLEILLRRFPLLAYTARYWGDHARGDPEHEIKELALKFLGDNSKLICSSQVMLYLRSRYRKRFRRFTEGVGELQVAASFGLAEIVQLLLERGADISAKDGGGRTALHRAAGSGHETVVRLLLEKGAEVAAKNKSGGMVLHSAARGGCEIVVRLLLERGADVNAKDNSGGTALHRAASSGHETVVRLLLEKGAEAAAKDESGMTALHSAARAGSETMVRLLLVKGAGVNAKDISEETALHNAVGGEHVAVVKLLLEEGADVAAKTRNGTMALHLAVSCGRETVVRLLLEKGADINAKNRYGWTALRLAASIGHEAMARLLIEKGADIAAIDDDGRTALHGAVYIGREAVVRLLLEKGADVAANDAGGTTALHGAASFGREAVVRLLLEMGADAAAKDNAGRTALFQAALYGHEAVVQLLAPLTPDS